MTESLKKLDNYLLKIIIHIWKWISLIYDDNNSI